MTSRLGDIDNTNILLTFKPKTLKCQGTCEKVDRFYDMNPLWGRLGRGKLGSDSSYPV